MSFAPGWRGTNNIMDDYDAMHTVYGPGSYCPNDKEVQENINFFQRVPDLHQHEPIEVTLTVSDGPKRKWNQCKICGIPMP